MTWQVLNIGSGAYETVYSVLASYISPPVDRINAAGLNPIDTKNYAVVAYHSENVLVRFDGNAVELLGKVAGGTVAATFDTDGTYYYSLLNQAGHSMYKIEGV